MFFTGLPTTNYDENDWLGIWRIEKSIIAVVLTYRKDLALVHSQQDKIKAIDDHVRESIRPEDMVLYETVLRNDLPHLLQLLNQHSQAEHMEIVKRLAPQEKVLVDCMDRSQAFYDHFGS